MAQRLERLPRCCPQHGDWQQLADHLCRDFPQVAGERVLSTVRNAQDVTRRFALDERDALDVGELIVRYRLLVGTGEIPDVARTDPQTHRVGDAQPADEERADVQSDTSIRV